MTQAASKSGTITAQLASFVAPYRGWVILNLAASLASAVVDVAGGYFIKTITDSMLNDQQLALSTVGLMLGTVTVGVVVKYAVKYTSGKFSAGALRDIRREAVMRVAQMPWSDVQARHSGDTVSRLTNDLTIVQNFLQSTLSEFIYQPIVFLAAFVYMATLNAGLLLIAVALVPLTIWLTKVLSRPLSKYRKQSQEGFAKMNAAAQDILGGIYIAKAFNLEEVLSARFQVAVDQVREGDQKMQWRLAVMTPLFVLVGNIPVISTAVYGGYLAIQNQMTPGSLFAFMYLLHFMVDPVSTLPDLISEWRSVTATAARILDVLHRPIERTDGEEFTMNPATPMIEFAKVSFAYCATVGVLSNMNFQIAPGKTVALVGHSGSGKSTVFKLLCGFHEPQDGTVRLYGRELSHWNLEGARRQVALVAQDTFLFPATIAENIAYGRPGAAREEIVAAARAANAHEFITELPNGYDSLVGERGIRLSGGERQRLGIARALLKDAPILLLDEPTSALDTQSEALVQQALERVAKGRTVLVIAHRLSTIKPADEILVLDHGCIVERGTHAELTAQEGAYQQLYRQQFEPEEIAHGRTDLTAEARPC